jgi:glycosyltransferase involved in cell wall biosynthesis
VAPDDPPALADALDRVLANPGAFEGAGISARAQARYGLAAVGAEINAVYAAALAGASAKG